MVEDTLALEQKQTLEWLHELRAQLAPICAENVRYDNLCERLSVLAAEALNVGLAAEIVQAAGGFTDLEMYMIRRYAQEFREDDEAVEHEARVRAAAQHAGLSYH